MGFAGGTGLEAGLAARCAAALAVGAEATRQWDDAPSGAALAACGRSALLSADGFAVAWDGRIDNRSDLPGGNAPGTSSLDDARLVLAAFARWGAAAFERIIGDYACAIWDMRARTFWLATDPGALRTLFFSTQAGRLLFATEQRGLFASPDTPRALDPEQMAAWLSMLPREPLRTFFRGINRVPPGHTVRWSAGEVRVERWWRPEDVPVLRLKRDADYEEALREGLREAVRCRIRPGEQIGSELSGGLDSSSVTAVAARELAGEGRALTAFTAAPRHAQPAVTGRFTDEWPRAAEVAALYPSIEHVRIDNDAEPILDALDRREAGIDWPVLNPSNTVWINAIHRAAGRRRLDVLLSGQRGNMTISYDGAELLAARLQRGDVVGTLATVRDLRRGGGRSWLGIAGQAADAVLPPPLRRRLRAALGKPERELFDYSAVRPEFLRRFSLADRAAEVAANLRNVARGDSRALRLAVLDRSDHRGHFAMSTRRLFGIDVRDPTGDRRLVELCLSIPDAQFAKGGVPRSLIRRAMAGLLPDSVLNERRKGLQAADWRVGFDAALPGIRAEIARMRHSPFASDCLDLDRIEALLDAWPGVDDTNDRARIDYLCAVSRGLAAGRFIRRIEGGNA